MKKFSLNKLKLPLSYYNYFSYMGTIVALVGLFMFVFLFVISFFFAEGGAYLGLILWMIIPAIIIMGLLAIPIGMIRKHKKDKKADPAN